MEGTEIMFNQVLPKIQATNLVKLAPKFKNAPQKNID